LWFIALPYNTRDGQDAHPTKRPNSSHKASNANILATGDIHGKITLWQITNGEQIFSWVAHTGWIRSIIFSADNDTLFSCSDDRTVKHWNLKGECLKVFQGHIGFVWSIALAYPMLVSGGNVEQVIKVWNSETGECLKSLQGHRDWICSVALTSDAQTIASGSQDSTINLWDVKTVTH
jgi:WD40 repeat protein